MDGLNACVKNELVLSLFIYVRVIIWFRLKGNKISVIQSKIQRMP